MPRHRIYFLLALYLLIHVGYLTALLLGPSVYHRELVTFDPKDPTLPAHKINVHAGSFNFLNDFVTLDLILLRDSDAQPLQCSLSTSVLVKGHKGARIETLFAERLTPISVTFGRTASVSGRARLFSRAVVDFVGLDLEVVLKFAEKELWSGVLVLSYLDTSHSIIELLVRLIFFFVGTTLLVYIVPIKKERTTSPEQLRILTVLIGMIVVASNPLIVLSYFTDSGFLPLVDAAAGLALVISTGAGVLLISEASHFSRATRQTDSYWKICAPFLAAGALYFLNSLLSQVYGATTSNSVFMVILGYARSGIAAICFLRVVVSLIDFKSEVRLERTVMAALTAVAFVVGMICELFLVAEPLIASSHEVQIFTFASVSTLVLFLTKFYWPVDASQLIDPDVGEE